MLDERFRSLKTTRAPDLWPDIEHREPGPPRREILWGRLGTAAVAFAVAAAGIAFAARAFLGDRPEPSERPAFSPTPPTDPPGSPRVVRTIDVGRAITVEGGFGSAWVKGFIGRTEDGRVLRVDGGTGRVTEVARHPVSGGGGTQLAVGAGSVWLATVGDTPEGPGATVIRIDPETNEQERISLVPGMAPTDVVVDNGVVWIPVEGEGVARLVGFDLRSDRRISVALPEGSPSGVFASGGAIWVDQVRWPSTGTPQRNEAGELVGVFFWSKVDPSTEKVTATIPVGNWGAVAPADDAIWVTRGRPTAHSFVALDPANARVVGEPIPAPPTYFLGIIEAGHNGIWFVGDDPDTGDAVLGWLNPFTGEVEASVNLGKGTPIVEMDATPGAIWVLRSNGSLIQVDPT
jgi:hypothetical protein